MLSLDQFKSLVVKTADFSQETPSKPTGRSSAFGRGANERLEPRQPTKKAPFILQLLKEANFGSRAQKFPKPDEVFGGRDASAFHSNTEELRDYLPERVATFRSEHHDTLILELENTATNLLETSLFKPLQSESRLEDALTRVAQAFLRGYEKAHNSNPSVGAAQEDTLCVVAVRDDRKSKKEEAPYLVCFATKWHDKYSGERSLVHFFLRQQCVEWEPRLRDTHLTQIYEGYFSKLNSPEWQNAFITSEEWKAANCVLEAFDENRGEDVVRGHMKELLEQVARNFKLDADESGDRLHFTRTRDHAIGLDPDKKLESQKAAFEATVVRDLKEHLLGYIIYCVDSTDEAEALRTSLSQNCFENVLVLAPDEDDDSLRFEVWQANRGLKDKLVQAGAQESLAARLISTLARFFVVGQSDVIDANGLATQLAARAKHLRQSVQLALRREAGDGPLSKLYASYKTNLVHSLSEKDFSDSYAQTVTYALLAARWLSRHSDRRFRLADAQEYLPITSPFLSSLATKLLNMDRSPRVRWLLQDITSLLERIDVEAVFESERNNDLINSDPIIHFYEPFLDAYDKSIREERGVYYTPDEVVAAMVNLTDDLVKTRFELPLGLADDTRWKDYANRHGMEIPKGISPNDFVVQILDPATGTGTFLKQVVTLIFERMMDHWRDKGLDNGPRQAAWESYVRDSLLPRLHGFEIIMAPYVICHLCLQLALEETGFSFESGGRLKVLLTNTLETSTPAQTDLTLSEELAAETAEAATTKESPGISVVIGNPPYSKISSNLNEEAVEYIKPFRYLNEQKIVERGALAFEMTLQDDYVKFFGFLLAKLSANPIAVGSYITNFRFLDSNYLRGMRESLRSNFDSIHILNLGGHRTEQEFLPMPDENVFKIEQGNAISLLARDVTSAKKSPQYYRVWGERREKLDWLNDISLNDVDWRKVTTPQGRNDFGVSSSAAEEFARWPALDEVFRKQSGAIITSRDNLTIDFSKEVLLNKVRRFAESPEGSAKLQEEIGFSIKKSWDAEKCKEQLKEDGIDKRHIRPILYRPFDLRKVFYFQSLIDTPSRPICNHIHGGPNLVLLTPKTKTTTEFSHVFISQHAVEKKSASNDRATTMFPLWLYPEQTANQPDVLKGLRSSNFSQSFIGNFTKFSSSSERGTLDERVFTYIYAVLHAPGYRQRYGKQLKNQFPRIPYPSNANLFNELAPLGNEIQAIHTGVTSSKPHKAPDCSVEFHNGGSTKVAKGYPKYKEEENAIFINSKSSFNQVTLEVWEYVLGGYPACKKWLKDRKGRSLSAKETDTYIAVVCAIEETIRLSAAIEEVVVRYGGWPDAFAAAGEDADVAVPEVVEERELTT